MYNKKKSVRFYLIYSFVLICINLQNKIELKNIGRSSWKKFFGFGLELGDSLAAISRAEERKRERESVSFAAEKRGTRSQSETGNLLGPIWLLGGEEKNSFRTRFSSLPCEIRDNERRYQRQNSPSPTLRPNPLFPPFIPFHPFLRALTKASEPFIISLVTSSTGENFLATQLRLVRRLPLPCRGTARFFHSFPFLARRRGGFFQPPRLDYAPWNCINALEINAKLLVAPFVTTLGADLKGEFCAPRTRENTIWWSFCGKVGLSLFYYFRAKWFSIKRR